MQLCNAITYFYLNSTNFKGDLAKRQTILELGKTQFHLNIVPISDLRVFQMLCGHRSKLRGMALNISTWGAHHLITSI